MRVLLDECIPRKFRNEFPDHECRTVPEVGLAGSTNGALLSLAEGAGFEIFLTMDKGLQYEQNLTGRNIAWSGDTGWRIVPGQFVPEDPAPAVPLICDIAYRFRLT